MRCPWREVDRGFKWFYSQLPPIPDKGVKERLLVLASKSHIPHVGGVRSSEFSVPCGRTAPFSRDASGGGWWKPVQVDVACQRTSHDCCRTTRRVLSEPCRPLPVAVDRRSLGC